VLIVGARVKARFDLATMIGWEARRFHHMKAPKPLAEYLKPPLTPEEKREQGAQKVRAMFQRMAKKKGAG
jgi:hypothetical protein